MNRFSDTAIILSVRKHGETSAIIRAFGRSHGVIAGVVKGASSKANRGLYQIGNVVDIKWSARLPEHLGMFKAELLEAHAAHIMADGAKLSALSSACALVESALPERHPYHKFYEVLAGFLGVLREAPSPLAGEESWLPAYVHLELALLAESGFGLDLSQCAATGATEDLIYVSPKSGRAVSREAGDPYKGKLLKLPPFLLTSPERGEVGALAPGGGELQAKINKYDSHSLIPNAKVLRSNMTEAEKKLWSQLRAHRFGGYRFRRQHPISQYYIADFICLEHKLIIELDGGQHAEQESYDKKRSEFLESEGYRVLRFWNNDVFENMEGVLTIIAEALTPSRSATLRDLPPNGGGEIVNPLPRSGGGLGRGYSEIIDGLALTGYFLEHWLLEPHGKKLPLARGRLLQTLYKPAETL